jgi:LysM repeat protein
MSKFLRFTLLGAFLFSLGFAMPSVAQAACPSPYTVQAGDYLYKIAANCGTSAAAIQAANKMTGTVVFIGQQLIIPGGSAVGGGGPTQPAGGSYTVQSGDNLYKIAVKFGTTVAAIQKANGLTTTVIHVGQVLKISGSSAPAVSNTTPVTVPVASGNSRTGGEKLLIANYFPWYDNNFWSQGATWDLPTIQYNSDDTSTIQRHIGWAQQAGIDGFAVHWYQAGNRTDSNLAKILSNSPAGFRSAATFLTHIQPGASRQFVIDNLRYLINNYGQQGNYLRVNGKPVIFFADMDRVSLEGAANAVSAWRSIRAEVDPGNTTIWIAEGLDPSYLNIFDGLYVYKVDHQCCPGSYVKAPTWAGWVRSYERTTGQTKFWVGTIMPGWDDTRSVGRPDLRSPSPAFARDRQGGAYYQATFNAVIGTNPDILLIHSFNEWIEGSEIEPGTTYGDLYLNLTKQFSNQFKGQ